MFCLSQSTAPPALAGLRQRIDYLEGTSRTRTMLPFGIAAVDGHLPGDGLVRRARGAVRKVCKFLGVPEDVTAGLSGLTWGWGNGGVTEADCRVTKFRDKLAREMTAQSYDVWFAERTFKQFEASAPMDFRRVMRRRSPTIAYASCWMKWHHPDVFCCAILKAQQMGFYAPAELMRDARAPGVEIRPVDVNHSRWDCTLELTRNRNRYAVRLGLRLVCGLANTDGGMVPIARGDEPYISIEDLWPRRNPRTSLERLAKGDAFGSLGINWRNALWTIKDLSGEVMPLFAAADEDRVIRSEVQEPRHRAHA